MLFVLNAKGEATYVSPSWLAQTGTPVTAALAFGWQDQLHPEDRDAAFATLGQAVAAQAPFSLRYRLRTADGGFAWFEAGGVPSFDPATRAFTGFVATFAPLGADADIAMARGQVEQRGPALPHPCPPSSRTGDLVVDHLASAHALLSEGDDEALLQLVAMGLYLAGRSRNGERRTTDGPDPMPEPTTASRAL